jgi:hypothetical protein
MTLIRNGLGELKSTPIEAESLKSTPIWDDLGCTPLNSTPIWDGRGGVSGFSYPEAAWEDWPPAAPIAPAL